MKIAELAFEDDAPLLASSPLWQRDLSGVSSLDLTLFLRLHNDRLLAAKAEVQHLITLTWTTMLQGRCKPPEMIYFDIPKERMSIEDLRAWTMQLPTPARRKAMLFGLEMNMPAGAVVDLTWAELKRLDLTPFAHTLLLCHSRHSRLPYVFWETSPAGNVVSPLIALADDVWSATDGIGYDRLLKLYRNMVPIDSELDLADFKQQMGEVLAARQN
ncbi:hypothetical protein DAI18_11575 [Microvirgula aerodenitrificans]|uniref:Uncharacterized protein n=1 Tax=Microvirgula aerodenitrificans TaxID=57480 RepID=A0A2S0PB45_9NEIS|nr:hypothetical protein [Microvirgula aerodenitrificans]AVY94609.1 hypothetical protein DAI18_11575 [Microvirgula aerodenitrificans]